MEEVVETDIVIQAPLERVWDILSDLSRYGEWNPLIVRAEGPLVRGGKISISVRIPQRKATSFRPTLLALEAKKELRWLGSLAIPSLFSGEHAFVLTDRADGSVHLLHRERFEGLLLRFLSRRWFKRVHQGFEAMNEALKARAENVASDFRQG